MEHKPLTQYARDVALRAPQSDAELRDAIGLLLTNLQEDEALLEASRQAEKRYAAAHAAPPTEISSLDEYRAHADRLALLNMERCAAQNTHNTHAARRQRLVYVIARTLPRDVWYRFDETTRLRCERGLTVQGDHVLTLTTAGSPLLAGPRERRFPVRL